MPAVYQQGHPLEFNHEKGPHPLGWVLTVLNANDELGSWGDHQVPKEHNLEQLYGVTARQIVECNGVPWDTPAINQWVKDTGGWATNTSIIWLPPGGPRTPASGGAKAGSPKGGSSSLLWVLAAIAGIGGAVVWARHQEKKGGGEA